MRLDCKRVLTGRLHKTMLERRMVGCAQVGFMGAVMAATRERRAGREVRIGLALGGGAELGLAHIGVLRVLERNGLCPSRIAGSSAGALVAGFYAAGTPLDVMERIGLRLKWRTIQRMTIPILALSTNEPLRRFLEMTLPVKDFSSLRMPLRVVTTDLLTAEMVVYEGGRGFVSSGMIEEPDIAFETGDLVEAIRASCTRPVINQPVQMGERLLVDGCLTNNVPAMLVRDMGADVVIGVDLLGSRGRVARPTNILSYAIRTQAINLHWALKNRHSAADVLIQPDFSDIGEPRFGRGQEIMLSGERAAESLVPAIRAATARCEAALEKSGERARGG